MSRGGTPGLLLVLAALLPAIGSAGGCAVARQLKDIPGDDAALLEQRDVDVAAVEKVLGSPLRTWSPREGRTYRQYVLRETTRGSASDAAAILFLDVISAGLAEVIASATGAFDPANDQPYRLVWVCFDARDRVCGVHDEFAILPAGDPQ